MQPIRQGEVILLPVQTEAQKLSHLTLAEGKLTGQQERPAQ